MAGKLALWQVLSRVIGQGSRLSAVRLAQRHAACDVLGLREGFNEEHLYTNLGWLSDNQVKQASHCGKDNHTCGAHMTGAELKALRKSLGLSLAQASRLVEVSARTWCRWESGQQRIPAGAGEQQPVAPAARRRAGPAEQRRVAPAEQ